MESNTVIKSADLEDPSEQWEAAKSDEAPLRSDDHPRSVANIAQWREYLPSDCVEAMIKDGWHRRV
jgi:hypothetical protein